MKNILPRNFLMLVFMMFIALLFAVTPAWSSDRLAAGKTYRFGKKEVTQAMIEKVGFFHGVKHGRVKIKDQKTYRIRTYIAAPGMIISFQEQLIDLLRIPPSSIVKLIIIDAEVIEIILMRRSS